MHIMRIALFSLVYLLSLKYSKYNQRKNTNSQQKEHASVPTLHRTTVESKLISSSQSKHSGSHSKNNDCNLLLHKMFTHRFYNPSLEKEIIHKPTQDEMNRNTEHNTSSPCIPPFLPTISKQMFCDEPQWLPSCSDGNSKDVHAHRQLAEQRENKLQKVQERMRAEI